MANPVGDGPTWQWRPLAARSTGLLTALVEGSAVAALSDGELLTRFVATRDERGELAFEALVRRHGPLVWGVCHRVLRDPSDADDAFQATWLILVRRAGSVRVDDSLGRWLHGVRPCGWLTERGGTAWFAQRRQGGSAGAIPDRRRPPTRSTTGSPRFERSLMTRWLGLPAPFRAAVVPLRPRRSDDRAGRLRDRLPRRDDQEPPQPRPALASGGQLTRRGFGGSAFLPNLIPLVRFSRPVSGGHHHSCSSIAAASVWSLRPVVALPSHIHRSELHMVLLTAKVGCRRCDRDAARNARFRP